MSIRNLVYAAVAAVAFLAIPTADAIAGTAERVRGAGATHNDHWATYACKRSGGDAAGAPYSCDIPYRVGGRDSPIGISATGTYFAYCPESSRKPARFYGSYPTSGKQRCWTDTSAGNSSELVLKCVNQKVGRWNNLFQGTAKVECYGN